ncbi:MAG: hydrolase [Acidobacteria bacterium]|nr:MAG: hydrolase [Acidobacteriota bacterium]
MLSRRDALLGAAVAGVAAFVRRPTTLSAKASQPATPVDFDVPAGACDCHTHIFGDSRRFSFTPSRAYTPETASIEEMRALHRTLHTDRVVIVQPSVYGTDNACTLDAIRQLGSDARGVAVIDDKTPDAALDKMARGGIRGIRVNLEAAGLTDPAAGRRRLQAAIQRVKSRTWHVQVYTRLSVIKGLEDQVLASPIPIVFDHFGGAEASLGVRQPGFDALLNLVRTGHAYVKVSGAYRSSTQLPDYADVAPLAKALIAANPQQVLWGTDWPHPDSSPVTGRKPTDVAQLLPIDDGRVFNQLATWAPDATERRMILVDNPARLYGF